MFPAKHTCKATEFVLEKSIGEAISLTGGDGPEELPVEKDRKRST